MRLKWVDVRDAVVGLEALYKDMDRQQRMENPVLLRDEDLASLHDALAALQQYDDELWEKEQMNG